MDLGLAGKVAIVTGASDGIGKAAAARFAAEGASVALLARTMSDLEVVADEISGATGSKVIPVSADVADEQAVKTAVGKVTNELGGIDILVNNAGQGNANRFEDMTNELVDGDFGVKVKGAIFMTRYALPHLKQSECGAICNITTAAGKAAPGGAQPTSLSRAAGISLTKAWSKEFGEYGIRVNTVCIGSIKSRQNRRHWEVARAKDPSYSLEDHWASYGPGIPLGRIGESEEAGDVIAFLCSPVASYISGAAVNVDGGAAPVY
jgi:NAD(P)-dependent dehydrogenase (short-subunit alcohol dehydrogenase family)